jgi:protein-disulfide isomerase
MTREAESTSRANQWRSLLDILVALSIVAVCITLVWVMIADRKRPHPRDGQPNPARRPTAPPAQAISLEGAAIKGDRNAKVAIIEYSEFECPYCARFASETLPALDKSYLATGKVLFAFRHMPLEKIHPSALLAAIAAECAGRQGRFWHMHDRLFQLPKPFTVAALREEARDLDLDSQRFSTCLDGEAIASVRKDMATAKALRITGTPTFLIGHIQPDGRVKVTHLLSGARPVAQFAGILDSLLKTSDSRQ